MSCVFGTIYSGFCVSGCLLLFMHGCMKFLQNIMHFGLVNLEIERFGGIEDFNKVTSVFAWFLSVFVIVSECFEMIAPTIGCLIFFACFAKRFACFEQFEFGIQ